MGYDLETSAQRIVDALREKPPLLIQVKKLLEQEGLGNETVWGLSRRNTMGDDDGWALFPTREAAALYAQEKAQERGWVFRGPYPVIIAPGLVVSMAQHGTLFGLQTRFSFEKKPITADLILHPAYASQHPWFRTKP